MNANIEIKWLKDSKLYMSNTQIICAEMPCGKLLRFCKKGKCKENKDYKKET